MNEGQIDLFQVYKNRINSISLEYKALTTSARNEMNVLEKTYNSGVLSRIGFVTQEMKDLKFELSRDIQVFLNNGSSDCFLEAQKSLENSTVEAGEVYKEVASKIINDLRMINEMGFYSKIHETENLISNFEMQSFLIFSQFNNVSNMVKLLSQLEMEVEIYSHLFENFVNDIYVEMFIFKMLTDELSREIFLKLNDGLEEFGRSIQFIRNSLNNCK